MFPLKPGLLTILLACCMLKPCAQTSCVPVFVNEYASSGHVEPYTMKALADGSFIIAGRGTANGTGSYDGMVMHVTATGIIIWSFLIGGAADDAFTGIAPLADGSFILSGSTASYGHPESKGWLVLLNNNGNLIWSRQIGSAHTGTDRIKAVTQYSDNDIIGTFNEDDSSALSNPVVFKIAEDGTLRWCTKFDNGYDDSYTSIAFSGTTIYASGYYSTATAKRGVITQLSAVTGAWINSKNIYRDDPYDQEIAGLEIFNNIISYGLWMHGIPNQSFATNGTVYVQTDMAGTKKMVVYVDNGGDASRMTTFRTQDSGFYMLRSTNTLPYQFSNVCKIDHNGLLEWGRVLNNYEAMANVALSVTADNGLASAHFYSDYYTNYTSRMRFVRLNNAGENGDCQLNSIGIFTDTLGYHEVPFSWSNSSAEIPDQTIITPPEIVNNPTLTNVCLNNLCVDKTPLPTGCNKTYRIEYSAAQALLFRDAVTTPDGGRITIGDNAYHSPNGVAVKTDVNGQPVWSKRFEFFSHPMNFLRILRSADNNYWIFGRDNYNDANNQGTRYIDLIKIDGSGNMLASSQLVEGDAGVKLAELADAVSTPDGGFVFMLNDSWGFGGTNSLIYRCDANGALLWEKQITHGGPAPVYKSIICSPDAIFLAYDCYDQAHYPNFGMERLDLKTGDLVWSKQYTIGNSNTEMINRIFSINDTTYTFVNNFAPFGAFNSIINTVMVKVDPQGNIFESLMLTGEAINPDPWFFLPYLCPPTITMTTKNDFVLSNKVIVNGVNKLNITRFDTSGRSSWSRDFESMNNHTPENIRQQGTGFLIIGKTDTTPPGSDPFTNGFLLKVDSSGQIMNNATGDCQQTNQLFSASSGSITETYLDPRTSIDIIGSSWTPVHISTLDIDVDPTAYCMQKAPCGVVALKQRGNGCSLQDTLVFYLQDAATCDASASWSYDTTYFHSLFSDGDSILLQPVQEGVSKMKATVEGNCFLNIQTINTSVLHGASKVNLGADTLLCAGNSIKLSAGPGFASYLWNDQSTDSTLIVNTSGIYFIQVADQCGTSASDTIQVRPADFAFHITGDSLSCNQAPAFLQVTPGYINYQWSPSPFSNGSGNIAQVTPAITTQYKVTAQKFPGCTVADSMIVHVLVSPIIVLGADTSLCAGDSLLILAPAGFSHYSWSTGDSALSIIAKNKGSYSVKAVYNNGCVSADTMKVLNLYAAPDPGLDKNPVICKGSTRELTTTQPFLKYWWNDGTTGNSIKVNSTGTYWVRVENQQGCYGSDTVDINTVGALPANFLPADTIVCSYTGALIQPHVDFVQYYWSTGEKDQSIQVKTAGEYILQVVDQEGCQGSDSIRIALKDCEALLVCPNAFTPNRDGHNDVFRLKYPGHAADYNLQVFNRWGQKMFETSDTSAGWDGDCNGQHQPEGNYIWIIRYTDNAGKKQNLQGSVVLIR